MPHGPSQLPAGLHLSQAARAVSQAFDDALQAAGGSLPVWLVLLNLAVRRPEHQRALAASVGIREATLTHHLNAMEKSGLLTRRRDEVNRRIHVVELTELGREAFRRMRGVAMGFNDRLTRGFGTDDREKLADLLDRLVANVGAGESEPTAPAPTIGHGFGTVPGHLDPPPSPRNLSPAADGGTR
jgi:MarR family transcriptional regulator, transcriptional regulator for hemolysin